MKRTFNKSLVTWGAIVIVLPAALAVAGCSHSNRMSAPPAVPRAQTGQNAIANDSHIPPQIKARILAHMQMNPSGPQRPGGFVPGHPMKDNSGATKS